MKKNNCCKKYNKCSKKVQIPKSFKVLDNFIDYCIDHPDQRFWQALRNWANVPFLVAQEDLPINGQEDTFYWEGRFHDED